MRIARAWSCPERRRAAARAVSAVAMAKLLGKLPYLRDGKTKCTDCDKPAQVYDHRDYSRPLEVEPVCQKCNIRRGPAKWIDTRTDWFGQGI